MDEFFKKMFRLRQGHRAAVERKRRIANLVSNSNCIGNTAHLFNCNRPRAVTGDLITQKKSVGKRTFRIKIKNNYIGEL